MKKNQFQEKTDSSKTRIKQAYSKLFSSDDNISTVFMLAGFELIIKNLGGGWK